MYSGADGCCIIKNKLVKRRSFPVNYLYPKDRSRNWAKKLNLNEAEINSYLLCSNLKTMFYVKFIVCNTSFFSCSSDRIEQLISASHSSFDSKRNCRDCLYLNCSFYLFFNELSNFSDHALNLYTLIFDRIGSIVLITI